MTDEEFEKALTDLIYAENGPEVIPISAKLREDRGALRDILWSCHENMETCGWSGHASIIMRIKELLAEDVHRRC